MTFFSKLWSIFLKQYLIKFVIHWVDTKFYLSIEARFSLSFVTDNNQHYKYQKR